MVTNSLIVPALDEVADSFDRGYEAGFIAGLQAHESNEFDRAFKAFRYLISSGYADMIVDGVTQDSPVVHDVFEYLFEVLDGKRPTRDYANWKPESKR